MSRRLLSIVAIAAVLVAGSCSGGGETFPLSARFERANGLYPGSPVRLQGVDVGTITNVRNVDGEVAVDMRIRGGTRLPADARAVIVPLSLLGERYVQLGPLHRSGPRLEPGATIPIERTAVPAEVDELLKGFERFLNAVEPTSLTRFVSNLADVLEGQGAALNELLGNATETFELLADESDELSEITTSLATLTRSLRSRTGAVTALLRDYETVAGVLASNRDDLDGTIVQLTRASTELAGLLTANRRPLHGSIEQLTVAGRTLQRNLDRLDAVFASTVELFEGAERSVDLERNWLNLNNQSQDEASDLLRASARDRLAGVCRRMAARLGAAAPPALSECGDPGSGYFDAAMAALDEGASARDAFVRGLSALPPLTGEQRAALDRLPAGVPAAAPLPPPPPRSPASGRSLLERILGVLPW